MNNNETATGSSATGNSTFLQQQKSIREREEEKRRLQAEMRRREQELLAKIKEQQRELESMKHEKGKVRSGIRFFSGCPDSKKVHIWNLHVIGNFWMQKISLTKFIRDPVLPRKLSFPAIFLNSSNMSIQNNNPKLRFLCSKLFPDSGIRIISQNYWPKSRSNRENWNA